MKLFKIKPCINQKILRMTRTSVFFMFFIVLALNSMAINTYSQTVRLSINIDRPNLKDAIVEIKKQTEFDFLYSKDVEHLYQASAQVKVKNGTIEEVLNQLFTHSRIKYQIVNNTIVLTPGNMATENKNTRQPSQQGITITGMVTDMDEPLPGVNVMVKGTTIGIITGADGKYTLTVPDRNAVLVFSYIGYVTQEVTVGDRTNINVIMGEDVLAIEEVVVIGYGTLRREAVTGSVASMKGDILREVQTGNVTAALAGRVAGVQIMQTDSKPGADMQIRIRGVRSLSASNDPLIVLDGIPFGGTIGDINPNDIKSIDILKDASATAIYGSRGANGVIIVTTDKGTKAAKAKASYNAYFGIKTLYSRYPMMSGDELYEMRKVAGIYKAGDEPSMGADEVKGVNTDWQDLMFKNSITANHNISVTGGNDNGSYLVSAGYLSDQSLMPNQDYSRINLRAAVDQGVGKYLRFGLTSNNNYNLTNGQNLGLYSTLASSPMMDPYNEDGSIKRVVRSIADNTWTYTRETVEALGDQRADNQRGFATYNSLFGEIKIPQIGLSYLVTAGLDLRTLDRGQYQGVGVFSETVTANSSASFSKSFYTKWSIEHLLTYDKQFDKHRVTINGLYAAEQSHYDRSYINATNIPADHFLYWNIGRAPTENIIFNPDNQQYWERGMISWMGRAMYNYDNRYMLSASIRRDGSSVLAKGHKYINYSAVSAGWNIANEGFMSSLDVINSLKLRGGWGITSNQAIDPYQTLGSLTDRRYNYGSSGTTGFYVSTVPNPELGWEYTQTWNIGVDFSLLKNRLNGTLEYYVANTYDILQSVSLPQSGGVGSYYANIGEMQNKGLELSLNGVIFDNKNGWTWEAGINFYTNSNKITKLATEDGKDEGNAWFVGHPINVIYDLEKIGLWQEGDPYLNILEPGGNVGMIKVKYTGEFNADGTPVRAIGAADRQIISADPKWLGGFNTRVAYKNWDLNLIGTYQHGGILVSTLHAANGYLNLLTGRRGNVKVDYWTPENTGAKYPKPGGLQSGDNQKYGTTMGYFDASYFKVGQITLGYNFDKKANWFQSIGFSNARLYFTLQNAFVLFSEFNKETGLDPVTNSRGNQNTAVVGGNYRASSMLTVGTNSPQTRNFIFGLNLSF